METMAETFPGIALWVRNVEAKNRKAEVYYASLWMGIRRWVSRETKAHNLLQLTIDTDHDQ
jgi:hypothetical protein